MNKSLHGIVTVLNTPLTSEDGIDPTGLRKNVAGALVAGVSGFLVPAMASEVGLLSRMERRELVRIVVQEAQGRAAVIGGASSEDIEESLALSRDYLQLGCDGLLVQISAESEIHALEKNLQRIAALRPPLMMLQDWDADGNGVPIDTIVRLFQRIEPFRWLKIEVVGAGPKYTEVKRATDGKLGIAGGWAVREMIDGLDRGVDAFMPTAMHRIYVQIYRRYIAGDRDGAIQLFDQIAPVLDYSNQDLNTSIWFFKRMLYRQGVYQTDRVRIDHARMSSHQLTTADQWIDRVMKIEEELVSQGIHPDFKID